MVCYGIFWSGQLLSYQLYFRTHLCNKRFLEPFICDIGAIYFHSFIHFLPPHYKLLKHLLSVQCVQCTNVFIFLVIHFFFILVPRLSGKEQLLFSFVKMAEPESIGGGTDTDHHDNKLVKVGFHTMQLCIL